MNDINLKNCYKKIVNRLIRLVKSSIKLNLVHLRKMLTEATGNKHKIAICQLTCTENKNENFNVCKSLIIDAKNQGAEVSSLYSEFYFSLRKEF